MAAPGGISRGVKEVTLLGQNVNSYRDTSEVQFCTAEPTHLSKGFHTLYRNKQGGLRFAALLEAVSNVNPEMRIRFTSPHPKDFPDEFALADFISGVSLSSDFIAGFCGETEEDHLETISLMRAVKYNVGYLFAYSMRNKTHAFHRLEDNVPGEVKQRRLEELIGVFREEALKLNCSVVGSTQLILVEGVSKRSRDELTGRTDGNIKVIFPDVKIPINDSSQDTAAVKPGDYVQVKSLLWRAGVTRRQVTLRLRQRESGLGTWCPLRDSLGRGGIPKSLSWGADWSQGSVRRLTVVEAGTEKVSCKESVSPVVWPRRVKQERH
ncbi:CK5P1 protein, partial [Polypterus senegalus]